MEKTRYLQLDPADPDPDLIAEAAEVIRRGLVAFPTETVYGLGNGMDPESVKRIFRVKGRPPENP